MKKLKRILTGIAVMTFMLSAVSCFQSKPITQNEEIQKEDTQKDTNQSAVIEKLTEPSKIDAEEIFLTMAIVVPREDEYRYKKPIDAFNKSDTGITIELKNYIDYYSGSTEGGYNPEGFKTADFQLMQDIINTDEIDIISNSSFNEALKYEALKSKNAFVDLYSFMESDAEINTDTLNSYILKLNETNGRLYTLPIRYGIKTLCGNKDYVGEKPNWTIDEFLSYWDNMPPDTTINGSRSSEYVYYAIVRDNISSFVDYENCSVNFDCEEFRKMLAFCSSFEYNNGRREEHSSDTVNFADVCMITGFSVADDYFSEENNTTVVGYPTLNGNGAYFHSLGSMYSINANSSKEKQEAAWKFIRSFATVESLMDNYIEGHEFVENGKKYVQYDSEQGFPINNEAFEMQKADILSGKYCSSGIDFNGEEFLEQPPASEDVDALVNYMDSIQRWEVISDYNLRKIVEEEVFEYLAGAIDIDTCIERIQNRASIWISEQS